MGQHSARHTRGREERLFPPLRNSHQRWVGQRRSRHHLKLGNYGSMKTAVPPAWGAQEDREQKIPELTPEGGTGLKLGREAGEGTADGVRGRSRGLSVKWPCVAKLFLSLCRHLHLYSS